MKLDHLPLELRALVHEVTDLWGEVIRDESGISTYRQIEGLRTFLKKFRNRASLEKNIRLTRALQTRMANFDGAELETVTHAFSVLLELINLCENSVRSLKIRSNRAVSAKPPSLDHEIYLVLTAHPTESRAPQVVEILNRIQRVLSRALFENPGAQSFDLREELNPLLRRLWYLRMARREQPRVQDEAEYIYSILFRDENLDALIGERARHVYVRTWVGGDKDGHPGVDEKVMLDSLQLARTHLYNALRRYLNDLENELETFIALSKTGLMKEAEAARKKVRSLSPLVSDLAKIRDRDITRILKFKRRFEAFEKFLSRPLKRSLISTSKINGLFETFPSLVVPLELRESSDVFREGTKSNPAILRMLRKLRALAGSSDPRGYARGLIISMTEKFEDLEAAEKFLKTALGKNYVLPLIPLFEKGEDLLHGPRIVEEWVRARKLRKMEVMLGYSDSAKEGGVLSSRLAIRDALFELEALHRKFPKLSLTYFHGSGGSVARGGGSLEEQTAHWPSAAFDRYKVTIQGEMIQRTFSTPEIFDQYLTKVETLGASRRKHPTKHTHPALARFAREVSNVYRSTVSDPEFLEMVEQASAYRFLEELRFGSRPSKRKKLEGVSSLRAIPWVLAWTQTRSLLPTWWGVGSAYREMSAGERRELAKLAHGGDLLFSSYLHQLGFTFAKMEPAIWHMYLEQSDLPEDKKKRFFEEFMKEFGWAQKAFRDLFGKSTPRSSWLWRKPWLEESIRLRSPMIHPLNVAQLRAWKTKNAGLVREASVGIACGMLTTG